MVIHLQILWIFKFHLPLYSEQLETFGIRMLRWCFALLCFSSVSYVLGRKGE